MTLYFLLNLAAAFFIALALTVMFVVALHNYRHFPRLALAIPDQIGTLPSVSVLIPARDEAELIGPTIASLVSSNYAGDFELIVLDDNSKDRTAQFARAAGQGFSRFSLLTGRPLPASWVGKPWACAQLAANAQGELLFFTDADVHWEPNALAAVVTQLEETGASLLTVWPTQVLGTWAERLVVPLMSFAVLAYLPVAWVHGLPQPQAAAANGQCLVFTRAAYESCGGHAAVRATVLDDVVLARRVKAAGLALRMADGAGLISTRMYAGWRQVRDGYAKNILAGHGDSITLLLLSILFHLGVFVLPWLWLIAGEPLGRLLPATLIAAGIGTRALTAATARQPVADAFLMPISVLLMTQIAGRAIWWRLRYGGPKWKGRTLTHG